MLGSFELLRAQENSVGHILVGNWNEGIWNGEPSMKSVICVRVAH
jgi:hypothetical protein